MTLRKQPVKAGVEIVGLNLGVWAVDRYVANGDFARISWKTMRHNLKTGFVWDNDQFVTNLFAHPYHGGLYYNAARTNGMSIGQSALFATGGSLMWEFLMENELPSLNDFIATPVGGLGLGEIAFRLSNLLIDSRTGGWERFGRELLAFTVNPVQGVNRLISGEAWKMHTYSGKAIESQPIRFTVSGGYRGLYDSRDTRIDNAGYLDFGLLYGDIFSRENERPYDAFTIGFTMNMLTKQPVFSNINLVGALWGKTVPNRNPKLDMRWGVYQHFDYYNSNTIVNEPNTDMYRLAEAAAFGLGGQLMYRFTDRTAFVSSAFLNAVLLGGSITDYYKVDERDYNISSGFGSKLNLNMVISEKIGLSVNAENYQFYTWNPSDDNDPEQQSGSSNPKYPNLRGDEGHTSFTVIKQSFKYAFKKRYFVTASSSVYLRYSNYVAYPNVHTEIFDSRVGIGVYF
jgi:hypothetical protein